MFYCLDVTSALSDSTPEYFQHAIDTLSQATVRQEIEIEQIAAPQKLAPYSYALGATIYQSSTSDDISAYGRMIFLFDPNGQESWKGTLRVVIYLEADLEPEMANDPLLPQVGWSWLTDAFVNHSLDYAALGGTVTTTASYRQGDIIGPEHIYKIEIRGSWTALSHNLHNHLHAYCEVLELAAGLPPLGISSIISR